MTSAHELDGASLQTIDSEAVRTESLRLEVAKLRGERRKLRLEAAEEYIGFGMQKLAGAGAIGLGILEAVHSPIVSAIHVDPLTALGAGAAILLGRSSIRLLKPFFDSLATK